MTQAVYENDLRKFGYRDGYEDAKIEYGLLLHQNEAKLTDKIAQLETVPAAALSQKSSD